MLPLLIASLILAAEVPLPPASSLSSSHAAYDGNALILTGQVLLDHGLGKMQAERASLQKQEAGADFPFALIELEKSVILHLKNNAALSCHEARLDFNELKGFLFSGENKQVVFSDTIRKNVFLEIKSLSAELFFSKSGQEEQKNDYEIESILAEDSVAIRYADAFQLYADRTTYQKQNSAQGKAKGTLFASAKNAGGQCTLAHEADLINATTIHVDLLHDKLTLLHPEGTLASSLFPRIKEGTIQFHSDHLLWDHTHNTLSLKGKAYLEETGVGMLSAEEELHLAYGEKEGKRYIKTVKTQGRAVLLYGTHELTCYGPIHLDRDSLNVSLSSPLENGVVPRGEQVSYQEGNVQVSGDKAQMEYALSEGLLHPIALVLKDNVRLFSMNDTMHKRWALADRLTYSPATRTFILSANPGKKVLFRDEEDSVAVSAQEVHITLDPETKKERIQGVGNVQLSLSSDEVNLLKKMFPSYE